MLRDLGGAGEVDTDEEEGGSERDLDEPLCALELQRDSQHSGACLYLPQTRLRTEPACMYDFLSLSLTHTHAHTLLFDRTHTHSAAGIIIAKISSINLFIHFHSALTFQRLMELRSSISSV